MKNIGWHFYRDYFDRATVNEVFQIKSSNLSEKRKSEAIERLFRAKNEDIFSQNFLENASNKYANQFDKYFKVVGDGKIILLKTTYPGMLSGSGLMHESGNIGEIKLGFMLDHTTGLPYLPGSSVKGLLRHIFPFRLMKQALSEKDATVRNKLKEKAKLLQNYCISIFKDLKIDIQAIELLDFEWQVFEGKIIENLGDVLTDNGETLFNKFKEKSIGIYDSDIFHDAYIIESLKHGGRFLANDFITPHKHPKSGKDPNFKKIDALVNPNPIQFMKVLPEVVWAFQFDLKDTKLSDSLTITSTQKLLLFRQILLDLGIGAKTNVGYGRLKPLPNS